MILETVPTETAKDVVARVIPRETYTRGARHGPLATFVPVTSLDNAISCTHQCYLYDIAYELYRPIQTMFRHIYLIYFKINSILIS